MFFIGWRKQVEPDLPKESESCLIEPDSTSQQQSSQKIEKSKPEVKTESTTDQQPQPDSTTVDTPTAVTETEGILQMVGNRLVRVFNHILFSRTNPNGSYRYEK